MNWLKITPSWVLKTLGISKFLGRLLHVPDEALPTAAAMAGVTNDQWRRVEKVQKMIAEDGIALLLPPLGGGE